MRLQAAVILLTSAMLVQAADPIPRFPLQASGGKWTAYEPAGEVSPGAGSTVLRQRGDEVLTSNSHRLAVNRATGAVNLSPRPAFPTGLEFVQLDGDSPVFWSSPIDGPTPRTFFLRDWTSGEKTGEHTPPEGIWPGYLDAHGMASLASDSLYLTDPAGGNVRQIPWATLGVNGYEKAIAGSEKWLAISYRTSASGQQRIAIFDRTTMELKTDKPQNGQAMSLHGDFLARQISSAVVLYRLPGLTESTAVPQDSPTKYGIIGHRLVEGGLWVIQQLSTDQNGVFRFYGLEAYPELRLRHRVPTPGALLPGAPSDPSWLATADSVAVADEAHTLWIWKRDSVENPQKPLVTLEPSKAGAEGDTAQVRLTLSYPKDQPVNVNLRAVSGSAVEGSDFAPWSQTVTLAPGAVEALAEIPILADTTLEANETFEVVMENATGALPEGDRVSLTITANGYNLEANPPVIAGGKLQWTHQYGSDGRIVVGLASRVLGVTGVTEGLVFWDMETSQVVATRAAGTFPPNSYDVSFRDNLAIISIDGFSAYRTDTGTLAGSWSLGHSGRFIGAVDATRVLIRRNYPEVLELRRVSDGELLASVPMENEASVAVSHDTRDGRPATIHVYRTGGAVFDRMQLNRLSTLDPDTLAETAGPVWRSYDQDSGDGAEIITVWEDKVLLSTYRGITAVDRSTGTPLWHVASQTYGLPDYVFGISGNVMAVSNLTVSSLEPSSTVYFIDLERGAIIDKLRPQDLSTDVQWWGAAIFAHDDGWTLTSRSRSFRVRRVPNRPNVEVIAPPFMDNLSASVSVKPVESFSGTFPIRVSEFEEMTTDRTANRLLAGLPVDLALDADGVDFSVSATRAVAGLENTWLRATAPGRQTLLAGFSRAPVNAHRVASTNNSFTTGGPARRTRARSVAAGDKLLAFGYPLELLAGGVRTGVVDLYHPVTGAFIRSIEVPAGSEGQRFGHAVGVSGDKVIVGAPGYQSMGRVFAYDGTTGGLIQELILKGKAGEFGSQIAVTSRWIAISAPGPSQPTIADSKKKSPGTVMVFDATTLKPVLTKTTSGEGFGRQIALAGDRLFVSAPGAPYNRMFSVGVVRAYAMPKGKQLGTIMAREPKALESFGQSLDASESMVVIGGMFDRSIGSAALQVHAASDLRFQGYYAMPGDLFSYSRMEVQGDWLIGGGSTLRFFRNGNPRPVASRSYQDPGGFTYPLPYFTSSTIVSDGSHLYWADTRPKRMPMPSLPASLAAARASALFSDDANQDGRSDELDRLFLHRGNASLPATAVFRESADGFMTFRLEADPDLPAGMDLWFEMSTDLQLWTTVLQWRRDAPGWRDATGKLLEVSAAGSAAMDHRSEARRVFFRTRAAGN